MPTYQSELESQKVFKGNIIIRFLGEYFSLHTPDSGLTLKKKYENILGSTILNPTTVDPKRVSTTIATNSIKLIDKKNVISALVKDKGLALIGQQVEIWIGRVGVGMAFSDYLKLPTTRIKKITKQDDSFTFSTSEETDRMARPIFHDSTRILGNILAATSTIVAKDDITDFPSSGFFHVDDEFISYASKDDATKTFSGCVRGEFNTIPAAHEDDTAAFVATQITANPIDIILQILTSGGGGGAYDVLDDGLGIDQNLIDIAEIESIRDELFADATFQLGLYGVENALADILEKELLAPNNLRFTYSANSKITLAVLDKAIFIESVNTMDHDSITKTPKLDIDDNKIVNRIEILWGFDESTGKMASKSVFKDASSIATYGERSPLNFSFKAIKPALNGSALVSKFATAMLARLSIPNPEISLTTHINKSLLNVGSKARLETTKIPNDSGQLNFAEELEVVSRSVNYETGDVTFKLAFTSFTGVRSCYLAPSDTFAVITSQSVAEVGAGRGAFWRAGWKVKLWDNNLNAYTADAVNTIESIDGDEITFENAWSTTITTHHRLKFCDYDDATNEQKRYCFISNNSEQPFSDNKKPYRISP